VHDEALRVVALIRHLRSFFSATHQETNA
jgi:hypothetical protein